MANITIIIPDDKIQRILDAFAAELNYNAATDGTKAQFTKAKVIEYVKQVTRNYETNVQIALDRNTIQTDVNSMAIT